MIVLVYSAHLRVLLPFFGRDNDLYSWLFLFLGLVPLAAIMVLVRRNMDTITDLMFKTPHPMLTPAAQQCPRCRSPIEADASFYAECGMGKLAQSSVATAKLCRQCGVENITTAKF